MNYYRLMEAHGSIAYQPEGATETPAAGSGGE
jgi:hypothetical protein